MQKLSYLFIFCLYLVNSWACMAENVPANQPIFSATQIHSDPIINEFGLVKKIEDAGYPFFIVTIEFPERKFSEVFTLNIENMHNLDAGQLSNLAGKYVRFDYTSEIENALVELRFNGKSVLPSTGRPPVSGTKAITGILSNAEEETTGDLPGEIYITTEEEYQITFPYYITPEIVVVNGKKVTAYYSERTQNTIIAIQQTK
ncbi:MAG: hypothetical protein ACKVTZ_04785 [Bacteroidia bacterium]